MKKIYIVLAIAIVVVLGGLFIISTNAPKASTGFEKASREAADINKEIVFDSVIDRNVYETKPTVKCDLSGTLSFSDEKGRRANSVLSIYATQDGGKKYIKGDLVQQGNEKYGGVELEDAYSTYGRIISSAKNKGFKLESEKKVEIKEGQESTYITTTILTKDDYRLEVRTFSYPEEPLIYERVDSTLKNTKCYKD